MRNVLIPVDFSEGSLNSIKYAIENVPKDTSVSMWLFHVYADQLIFQPSFDIDGYMVDPVVDYELFEELKKVAEQNLDKLEKEVKDYITKKQYDNIVLKKRLIQGDPEWTLKNTCEELTPDVIIMSTHGAGNKGPLEGSMAKKIMGKAIVPVLAVPNDFYDYELKKVLFVTHMEHVKGDIDAVKLIYERLSHLDIKVEIVYFKESDNDNETLQDFVDAFPDEILKNRLIVSVRHFEEENIIDVAKNSNIDLIAFVAHKVNPFKHLFKRVISKKELFETGLPILSLPQDIS